jgi:hypothetical protein
MPNNLEISLLERLRREPLVNSLKGLQPIFSGFDTNPSSPENITDGDLNTVTGTGIRVIGASTEFAHIEYTLPVKALYLVFGKIGIWSSVGTFSIRLYSMPNDVTYQWSGTPILTRTTTTEAVHNVLSSILSGDMIRFTCNSGAAGTYNIKIYELAAYKIA